MPARAQPAAPDRLNLEEIGRLSTVVQPTEDEGRGTVRVLLEPIEQPERASIQRYLPTRLSPRRSCGCAPEPASIGAGPETGGVAV